MDNTNYTPISQEKSPNPSLSQEVNAFLLKNSRFIKKDARDARLFRSPNHDDYLILKTETELAKRLQAEYELVEVFDDVANEVPRVRELITLKIWKEDERKDKIRELSQICHASNMAIKDAEYATNLTVRSLYDRCKELPQEINEITAQIQRIKDHSQSQEIWSDPIPLEDELLPVAPFDPLLLPEPLRRYAEDVAESIQCPIDYIAVGLLTTFSSIIGAGCAIRPKKEGSWSVIPNLWGAIVGTSSQKKTPALNAAMVSIGPLEKEASEGFAKQERREKIEQIEIAARKKNLKADIEKASKDGNDHALEIAKNALYELEEKSVSVRHKRYKTNDSSVAMLQELLVDNPRGLLVFRDELIGFLDCLEREYDSGSRAFYMEGWTGYSTAEVKIDRLERGSLSCNPCISILGGITPSKLSLYFQKSLSKIGNDGFIQRFQLLVFPDPLKKFSLIDRPDDREAREQVISIGIYLAKTDFISMGAKLEEDTPLPVFRFSPTAQQFFNKWYTDLEIRCRTQLEGQMIGEHLGKYSKLMPALALIDHLIRIAAGSPQSEGISLEAVQRAAALCAYFESHARRVYSMIERRGIDAAKGLLKKIREGKVGDGFSQREIYRNGWTGLDRAGVEDACDELIRKNWLKEGVSPPTVKGGVPGYRYHLHPSLLKTSIPGTDKTDE
jgi:hypothetical protein